MIGAGVHLYKYRDVHMQKFCKGGGGANLGGGRICKQRQREHWKKMLKISLVILRGRD